MSYPIENPPQIYPQVDENGFVTLTVEEWSNLMIWLEKFKKYVDDHI